MTQTATQADRNEGYSPVQEGDPAPNARLTVIQPWVSELSLMQQTVLLTAIRGPDGSPKYGDSKMLVRWFRRCVLLGSFERAAFKTPYDLGGGSFTGPSIPRYMLLGVLVDRTKNLAACNSLSDGELVERYRDEVGEWTAFMDDIVSRYLRELDALPHHFQLHLMHAAEILGYKHPEPVTRGWWFKTYERLAHDMHLWPETEAQLDARLGDSREGWLARNDAATVD